MAGSSLLRMQSDERLVALIRDGHDPAFAALVDRYRGELMRYCTRLVGESRAEDILQQVLLNAHGAMTSSDTDIQVRPWLYRIAHNTGLNVLRSSRQEAELDDQLAAGGGLEHDVETRERLRDALTAIARLPEPQRDALTLRALEGRSHQEIAIALGVSPGAARQHLHRARSTVRAAVSAITPYGLIARFAMAGGGEPAAAALLTGAGAGATAGLGATVTKIGAGVLAAGAIATGTTGNVPFVSHGDRSQPAAAKASTATPTATGAEAASAAIASDPSDGPAANATGEGAGQAGTKGTRRSGDHRGGRSPGKHGLGAAGPQGEDDDSRSNGDDRRHGRDDSERDHPGSQGSGHDDSERDGSQRDDSADRQSGDDRRRDSSDDEPSSDGEDSGRDHSGSGDGSSGSQPDEVEPIEADDSHSGRRDRQRLPAGSSGSGSGDDPPEALETPDPPEPEAD